MLADHLVIGFPHASGNWVVVLPDFVGVTGRGDNLEEATRQALERVAAVVETLMKVDAQLPAPQDLARIQRDPLWSGEYGVDWEQAVVTTVSLPLAEGTATSDAETAAPLANASASLIPSADPGPLPLKNLVAGDEADAQKLPTTTALAAGIHGQ